MELTHGEERSREMRIYTRGGLSETRGVLEKAVLKKWGATSL